MNNYINKYKNIYMTMIITFLFSFIDHGFKWFNHIPNHDSIGFALWPMQDFIISLGRFIQGIHKVFIGNIVSPVIQGIFVSIFVSLTVYYIMKIFTIKKFNIVP